MLNLRTVAVSFVPSSVSQHPIVPLLIPSESSICEDALMTR